MPSPTFRHTLLLLAICALTFFANLGASRLWDRDEPRNAGCTREMLQRGDWVVPVFNGELRTHKPVLLYWLMMTSYAALGDNEWGARFWSAALAAGSVLMTYAIGRRLFNSSAALWGGIVLASNLQFAMIGRAATPEMLFSFCLTAAMLVYVLGAFRPKNQSEDAHEPILSRSDETRPFFPTWPVAALMFAVVGLAILAKGPAGLVLPVAVVGMFLLIMRLAAPSGIPETVLPLPPGEGRGEGTLEYESRSTPSAPSPQPSPGGRGRRFLRAVARTFAPLHFLRTAWSMRPITALLVAGAVAVPWYYLVWQRTDGEWVRGFIFEHNVGRAARPMEGHGGSAWVYPLTVLFYYPLATLAGFLPWSLLIVPIVMDAVARVRRRDPWWPGYVFLACWFGVYLAAFSVARTKLPSYMTPAYPALALAAGCFVHHWVRNRSTAPAKSVSDALVLMAGVGAATIVALPIAVWVLGRGVPGLRREVWVGLVGLVPLAAAVLALRRLRTPDVFGAARAFAVGAVALVAAVFAVVVVRVDRYQHSRGVMAAIEQRSDAPRIASFNRLEPSWVYYSGQTIKDYKTTADAAKFLASGPDAFIITSEEKLPQIAPGFPPGVGVVQRVPYFGRKGELLVIGHERGDDAVVGTRGAAEQSLAEQAKGS